MIGSKVPYFRLTKRDNPPREFFGWVFSFILKIWLKKGIIEQMNQSQEESLRRTLSRMVERGFTRQDVIDVLKETGTPKIPEIQKLVDEYFPEATW